MNWIAAQGGLPGEQFAQSVLNADAVQAMQLIVALVVVALVLVIWLNGRSVKEMTGTQAGMARTNERFFEADSKKTAVLQTAVDEIRLMRESHDREAHNHQRGLEESVRAINEKAEAHVVSINDHTTQRTKFVSDVVTNLMVDAVTTVNKATQATVAPALEALLEIKESFAAIQTLQQGQAELFKQQQDGYTRIMNNLVARAEKIILDSISDTESKLDEKPVPDPALLALADPVPVGMSDGSAPPLGSG